jgi:hypothetical protein
MTRIRQFSCANTLHDAHTAILMREHGSMGFSDRSRNQLEQRHTADQRS